MKTDHGTNLVSLHSIQTYNINYLSKFKLMPVKIKTDRIISFYKTIANATRFYYNLSEPITMTKMIVPNIYQN